jgi:APA family basic amino acid/polyamine antiporter
MKTLGIWTLIALVVGNMVGSGIFLLPSSLAQLGSISLLSWVVTSAGAICIAIVFARLSRLLPKAGGPYAYCHDAFGSFTGLIIAYLYWIYSWVGNAAIATSLISYLSYFFPVIAESHFYSFVSIAGIVWLLTFVNILGVSKVGKLQIITVALKLAPLIVISLIGLFYIKLSNFTAFNLTSQSNFAALSSSAALTMWALTGIESATVPADHVKNPGRNIPLATILGTVIAILLYVLSTIVLMGIIPMKELAASNAPFAEAANLTMGQLGGLTIALAAIISSVGALNGWILLQGQVPYAASVNKVFPSFFGKLSRHETPANALVLSSILITILLGMSYEKSMVSRFTSIISLATDSILIVYGMAVLAEIVMLVKRNMYQHFYKKITVNILALIYIGWAIYGSDHEMLFYCVLLGFTGIPFYFFSQKSPALAEENGTH